MTDSNMPEKLVPHLVIELNGKEGKFLARRGTPKFLIYKQINAARAKKEDDQADAVGVIFEYVQWSINDPEEFERCYNFLVENSDDENFDDKLLTALNALWGGETNLPLERGSTDSSEPTSPTESSSTENSSDPDTNDKKPRKKNSTSSQA